MNEDQIESPLTYHYTNFNPCEKFNLYHGELLINENNGNNSKVIGDIDFSYTPHPRVEISFLSNSEIGSSIWDFTLLHPECNIPIDCLVKKSSYKPEKQAFQILALIKSNPKPSNNLRLTKVKFYLVNFPYVLGRPIKEINHTSWQGRYLLKTNEWKITIDALKDINNIEKYLKDNGCYAITHLCQIEKVDNQSFSVEEVEKQLECLYYFLSFASGIWVTPILFVGFDENERKVWECWEGYHVENHRYVFQWLPLSDVQGLEQCFKGFSERWNDPKWNEILEWLVYCYLESNKNSLFLEAVIPLQQIALEMLSNFLLDDADKVRLNKSGEEKDKQAHEKIRLLLSNHYQIPLTIPNKLTDLLKVSQEEKWEDGIEAITRIRNLIIHLKLDSLKKLAIWRDTEVIYEAQQLGQYYLERVLLRICDYQGRYVYRFKQNDWQDLKGEPFVGIWKDRDDMKDSDEWLRQPRKQEH